MTNSEIRLRAIEELETNGWIQGNLHTPEGSCVLGAISLVTAISENIPGSLLDSDFLSVVKELEAETRMPIGIWNDQPGRTKEEVIDVLRPKTEAGLETPETEHVFIPEPKPMVIPVPEPVEAPVEAPVPA